MVRVCFALAALPLAQAVATPDAWHRDHGSAHLIETATKLLQKSRKEALTPTIKKFAEATIEKIENEVLPDIKKEHEVSVTLIEEEYKRFGALLDEAKSREAEITSLDEEVSQHSQTHKECRVEEKTIVEQVEECTTKKEGYWNTITSTEDVLVIDEEAIERIWCENSYDPLSKEFYEQNVEAMKSYTDRIEKIEKEWIEHDKVSCETKEVEKTEQTQKCDVTQTTLEETSCKRANKVEELTEHFKTEWGVLTTSYDAVVENAKAEVTKMKEEFLGLHIVQCLLQEVIKISELEGPCNESHYEEVQTQIKKCHEIGEDHEIKKEVTELEINHDVAPEFPHPLYHHAAFPCTQEFLTLHYSNVPAEAAQKACSNEHCSAKVIAQTVTTEEH